MNNRIAIAVHGGAGPVSSTVRQRPAEHKFGLQMAVDEGYSILENGGSATDAVAAAVRVLEDDPLFNAGKGSAKTEHGEPQMCAAIMEGKELKSGAVALITNIKNPALLARLVMERSPHVFLAGNGAMRFAEAMNVEFVPADYFEPTPEFKKHGTVGAVACDAHGNVAACTSTGGLDDSAEGRIADSALVGAGVYANNNSCAVSATGEGEYIIQHVLSHHLHALVEFNRMRVDEAAAYLVYQKLKEENHDMGLIAVDPNGIIGMAYNSERMHRAWKTSDGDSGVRIYREE